MQSSPILQAILKRSSYYDSDYRQSAALIRARRPYLLRNTVTGIAIFTFAISVFAFTIKAVGQEKFEDVVVPDAPRQSSGSSPPPKTPNVAANGVQS